MKKMKDKPNKLVKIWRILKLWWKYTFYPKNRLSQPVRLSLRAWKKRKKYSRYTIYKFLKIGWLRFNKNGGICVSEKGNKQRLKYW